MTIASAFNEIAVAQGGAASKSGSIAGAIDALNDALAGSDQQAAQTIEDAVRLLGANIGSGGSDIEYNIHCGRMNPQTFEVTEVANCAYKGVWDSESGKFVADTATGIIDKSHPGESIVLYDGTLLGMVIVADSADMETAKFFISTNGGFYSCPMPSSDAWFIYITA